MNSDRFVRTMLVLIMVLLFVDVVRPYLKTHVAAAPTAVQYKIVRAVNCDEGGAAAVEKDEAMLNNLARQGWEVVTSAAGGCEVIFKK